MNSKLPPKKGSLRLPKSNCPYYGQSIGIIMLDMSTMTGGATVTAGQSTQLEGFTRVPGDVGNASSFGFSVQYKMIKGITTNDVINANPSDKGIEVIVQASRELEQEGVRAIATTCGLFSIFQTAMAEAVEIPVFSSALLQVPMVSHLIGKHRKVGIITANSDILTEAHLTAVGIDGSVPHVLWGTQARPPEENFWVWDELDPHTRTGQLEEKLALTAQRMQEEHPDIGAIVLECTNTPPGSHAIQQATGLPVYDVITLIKWAHSGVVQRRYIDQGYM